MRKHKNEFTVSSFNRDKFLYNPVSDAKFGGIFAEILKFTEENQIKDIELWKKFVYQFKFNSDDHDNGWRCEYWGKMMRGAAAICAYSQDEELYKILEDSVRDLLSAQDELGRISSYSTEAEFHGWDMWGRKYVLLGLQYFYEICDDEALKTEIIAVMCRHLDYIIAKIGSDKIKITETSTFWLCANACSILEPIVRLYKFTGKKEYMDFADYIVEVCHGSENELTIFKLAYENELLPHQYPEQKAYETMSCFEGLAEYYRMTGIEKYKKAVINFAEKVRENEISIIGCSGCTHEIFDNTRLSQVDPKFDGIMQETCVSVTWMKYCGQVLRLTGDPAYADCIEQTFFNAFIGAANTHKNEVKVSSDGKNYCGFLPFDSYSALRATEKGIMTGGMKVMSDGSFYGCCACISPMAFGTVASHAALISEDGIVLNFYLNGHLSAQTPSGKIAKFDIKSDYPYGNSVKITVNCEEELFDLALRIPEWSKNTEIKVNNEDIPAENGYKHIKKSWKTGDIVEIEFDSRIFRIDPPEDSLYKNDYVALRKGALMLAIDRRAGVDPKTPVSINFNKDGTVDGKILSNKEIPDAELTVSVPTTDGDTLILIDYASAGKTFDKESTHAAWLKNKYSQKKVLIMKEILFSDLTQIVKNKNAVTADLTSKNWFAMDYEISETKGKALVAGEETEPEDAILAPQLKGWHRIYICTVKMEFQNRFHLKLSSDIAFESVVPPKEGTPSKWAPYEYAQEFFWKCADMSDNDIILKKPKGFNNEGSAVTWFRFEEMTTEEVEEYKAYTSTKSNKNAHYHYDGNENTMEAIAENDNVLSRYSRLKNSDAEICSMEITSDYDVKKSPETMMRKASRLIADGDTVHRENKEKYYKTKIDFLHSINVEALAAYRMSIADLGIDFDGHIKTGFVQKHSEMFCKIRDGRTVQVCSFAYPEVWDYAINGFKEALGYGFDGVSLILHRGIMIGFEEPVIKRFHEKYPDIDPCLLPIKDPRMHGIWCEFMTEFMTKLRKELDEFAGRHVKINIITDYSPETAKHIGIDIETWAKNGLIDCICQDTMELYEQIDDCMDGEFIDMKKYIEKCKVTETVRRFHFHDLEKIIEGAKKYMEIAAKYNVKFYGGIFSWPSDAETIIENRKKLKEIGVKNFSVYNFVHLSVHQPLYHALANLCHDKINEKYCAVKNFKVQMLNGFDISTYNPNWRA